MHLEKRGLIVCILLALAVPLATGTHHHSIGLNPIEFYETNDIWFNLTLGNWLSQDVINQVQLTLTNAEITDVRAFAGWDYTNTPTSVTWVNGTIETNILQALFQFKAKANKVSQNESSDWTIITRDDQGDTDTTTIQITILDDTTPPVLSNIIPINGTYVKAGLPDQLVSVDAVDSETGVANASVEWNNCSGPETTTLLTCTSATCNSTINISDYQEGDNLCYEFIVYNNADELATYTGIVGVDATPPTITLLAPANGAYASGNTAFMFNASDNLSPTLECTVNVAGTFNTQLTVTNNAINNVFIDVDNLSEGVHLWNVVCEDQAGWETTSASRNIILDKTAPTITLISPNNGSVIAAGTLIVVNTTDNYELDTINYSLPLDTTTWSEGQNDLVITATDKAGNIAVETFTFYIDRTAPQIMLLNPNNNDTIDYHVNFTFSVSDNYDTSIQCSLNVDGNNVATPEINTGDTYIYSTQLALGAHAWYVTCTDDVGNSNTTETRTVNLIDASGPDITITAVDNVVRGQAVNIEAEVTDISGVDNVEADVDGTAVTLTKTGDTYSGTYQTTTTQALGDYAITFNANDTLGYSSTATELFTLIYGYDITLAVTPSSTIPNGNVEVSGTILYDNGSFIPEDTVTLTLPEEIVNETINATGHFAHTFTAPSNTGNYEIIAEVISSNNVTYNATATLAVVSLGGSSSSSPSSTPSGSGGGKYCGNGYCSGTETCKNCPEDCGACPPKEKPKGGGTYEEEEEEPVEPEEESLPIEEPRSPLGVGKASGWFNLNQLQVLFGVFLLTLILLTTMSYYGRRRKNEPKLNWKGYFEKRR